MRPLGVVVLDVLRHQVVEVLLAEHDESVQGFLPMPRAGTGR